MKDEESKSFVEEWKNHLARVDLSLSDKEFSFVEFISFAERFSAVSILNSDLRL
ncbi:MAG: hypothetical protein PHX25_00245 [Candidatus Pacebacteria bacterium]|nr:hypothetical protein [Candidatus Paceibacterota bacterium]